MELKKVGVVGSNSRAVAESAKRAGYDVYLVDYFSDLDTLKSADRVFSLQNDPFHPDLHKGYSPEKMAEFAIESLEDVDGVLLTSNLGSDFKMVKKLEMHFEILGNSSGQVKRARNWRGLIDALHGLGIKHPKTILSDASKLKRDVNKLNYPGIIKPIVEKEFPIMFVNNESEFDDYHDIFKKVKNTEILIQEHIQGIPISASVLSSGDKAVALSVNQQLIGVEAFGAQPFVYCGGIVPLCERSPKTAEIEGMSARLIKELDLIGSNGIDYVMENRTHDIYFMEINPRFQDTLELVERYREINLVEGHLNSLNGELTAGNYRSPGYYAKGIFFATQKNFAMQNFNSQYEYCDQKTRVGDLSGIDGVKDVPRGGAIIQKQDPICSVIVEGQSKADVVRALLDNVGLIRNSLG